MIIYGHLYDEMRRGLNQRFWFGKKNRKYENLNYFTPDVPLELGGNQKGMKQALFHKVM